MTITISINSDIGEGYGTYKMADDETLLHLISDANVACGFHAGDPRIMRRTCEIAASNGVAVGAHFSFYDLRGFGRQPVEIDPAALRDDLIYQIGALTAIAHASGTRVGYVKPHGALYHSAIRRPEYTAALLDAIQQADAALSLLCQPGTSLSREASARGIKTLREGYIDRTYLPEGLLTPRSQPGALVSDVDVAAARALQIVTEQTVTATDGSVIPMTVDSLCIHSDSPGAVDFARAVRSALDAAGVKVAPLVADIQEAS